jgi:dCMP deaminase
MKRNFKVPEVDNKWDRHFMKMAAVASEMSKDPSTQVGAVAVGPNREVRSTGYNGMPIGVDDSVIERTSNRDLKLLFFEHAERNTIILAARHGTPTEGCTMYINGSSGGLPPCASCARAMIQAGIVRVVITSTFMPERWKDTCMAGMQMLFEAGVVVEKLADLQT